MDEKNTTAPYYAEPGFRTLSFMLNLRLTKLLARLDSKAMAGRIHADPHGLEMTELILFWHLGCDLRKTANDSKRSRNSTEGHACWDRYPLGANPAWSSFLGLRGLSESRKNAHPKWTLELGLF